MLPMTITLAQIAAVASTVIALALAVLSVVAIPALWRFRRTYRKADHLLERIYSDITPIMHNANVISENVNFVTTAVREDIRKVSDTIDDANARIQDALEATEQRVRELHALLAVAQEEAEHLFVDTASTMRGIRRGAEAFRNRGGMEFASVESDPADAADELVLLEEGDGDDSSIESTPHAPAPRVRPRSPRRRA
jgi:uncharacterized protein YoxC